VLKISRWLRANLARSSDPFGSSDIGIDPVLQSFTDWTRRTAHLNSTCLTT
jgi:hypothetical protein